MELTDYTYSDVPGDNRPSVSLILYSLSTCGFCKRAKDFLSREGYPYRYLDVDLLPLEEKQKIKGEFYNLHNNKMVFPTLCIGTETYLSGFNSGRWSAALEKLKETGDA